MWEDFSRLKDFISAMNWCVVTEQAGAQRSVCCMRALFEWVPVHALHETGGAGVAQVAGKFGWPQGI